MTALRRSGAPVLLLLLTYDLFTICKFLVKLSHANVHVQHDVAPWLNGSVLVSINEVRLRACLVVGSVTVCGRVNQLGL